MLQPFAVAEATLDWYRRYVRASFPLADPALDGQRERLLDSGLLWAEPHVALARPGQTGPKLASLAETLLDETLALPWGFSDLYGHQERAIRRLAGAAGGGPQNTLVLSGTGSGKTESFLIPVVDACLRDPRPGIKALVVYPMNALANDQLNRLRRLLRRASAVTYGRYTGDTPETDAGDPRRPPRPEGEPANHRWSRRAMRDEPPSILLTNYTMLEYLLLRGKDEELFRHGPPTYLIVDEIHLFTGVLGAEVAALLRRFRQHVSTDTRDICMVGTSATAGSDAETEQLRQFAERFFGSTFGPDALIAETPAPFAPAGDLVPPPPHISPELLSAATTAGGLAALARAVLGLDAPDDNRVGESLGREIDRFRTVSVVELALARPAPLSAAATALGALPERSGVDESALLAEAQAIVLLGAAARLPASVGEEDGQPRFRPRVHQFLRSLAGLRRCTDPSHGTLSPPDEGRCSCSAMALPVATCRTCGEAFWTSPISRPDLGAVDRLVDRQPNRGDPAVFLADPARLSSVIEDDDEGDHVGWETLHLCPGCGAASTLERPLAHERACPRTAAEVFLLAAPRADQCPACGSKGARNRPILLPLTGSAAASVAVITSSLALELRNRSDDAGGRLLVFTDSRQNAAQQAGYSDDQGARVAMRQLVARAVAERTRLTLPELVRAVGEAVVDEPSALRRWLVGEASRDFAEVADSGYVVSPQDRERIIRQLEWEIVLEVTERSRQRVSLERQGLVVVEIDDLDRIVARVSEMWPTTPFSEHVLGQVVAAVADVLRYGRAVSHWLLCRDPRFLTRNHSIRLGDQAIVATRGYADAKFHSRADGVDIRPWTSKSNATRLTELVGRVLDKPSTLVNEVVEALIARLQSSGLLTQRRVGSRARWMLDHERLVVGHRSNEQLWRCERCGTVRGFVLTAADGRSLCMNWRCPGTPSPWAPPAERDFYRRQYATTPRRLVVREHSGQIPGETRLALEAAFNDASSPLVDALACTPTLEVGVSLDDLHAVILRNLPPTPANYAQRVGRAGRRSKVALAVAHAGHGPHDAYYFEQPGELIAGEVRAPAISLDNDPLLRRHVNSLVLEVLRIDLPQHWVPSPDGSTPEGEPTVADVDGVLRDSTIRPFAERLADPAVRKRVDEAVRGAFASPRDPAPPDGAEELCLDQVDRFIADLQAAFHRWCDRYRALLDEFKAAQRRPGLPSPAERDEQNRLYREILRLASPSAPGQRPLGFLGVVGFLPRYGFTADTVLMHPAGGGEPIAQAAPVAVTEFAPGNIVYARGRRLKVRRLDPPPVEEATAGPNHRDNVLGQGRRCEPCEYFTTNPLEKACPTCGIDLQTRAVLRLTGVFASGGAISSEDEFRRRSAYELHYLLGSAPQPARAVELGGYRMEWSRGRPITVANAGLLPADNEPAPGFEICTFCGYAGETRETPDPGDEADDFEDAGHKPYCPARRDPHSEVVVKPVWLTAGLQGDVIEIILPAATRGPGFAGWRATLAESLLLGVRETMQAGRGDLAWFERRQAREPHALVLYDTMPGGTGYVPKLFADSATGLREAAAEAVRRLEACTCASSCHRCLRDYWNQGHHPRLNRYEVLGTLRRLADLDVTEGIEPDDARLESYLEREFFERLGASGIRTPTLQVVRVIGGRRIIRVDCEYRDPAVSIFLDGREWHAGSREKILHDLEARNELEAKDICVLEYAYGDVMVDFDRVAGELRQVLDGASGDRHSVDVSRLPGLHVVEVDERAGRATVRVDPERWVESESARRSSLASANRARLAGWRLRRIR